MATSRRSPFGRALVACATLLAGYQFASTVNFVGPVARSGVQSISSASTNEARGSVARASLGRRSGVVAAGAALALNFGRPVNAALKKDDDYGSDFSSLDGLLAKDFGQAQEETKCKKQDEGEERIFCVEREIAAKNKEIAAAKGEEYKGPTKGTLSGGSYAK
mmetsp:Transcript_30501/g.66826  ORF Transcript_30501/g.66826 Transcript_30501/m.66826 type:complete len:163 (-) Transcript_30501:284-772(-)|eukprot:CAMPEP_0170590146 /NCGR_PEP_ID=MMETSP0224-20130122/11713_1 /TAXON_ID=285029 /ORGANISM="Togula jolla, Strain CCCM 725" /LENGTH=162 /DNA_ID=CAMNT_0010913921 /DNA_START=25 /DNA_END=513 /DNA_ORIENTATION=+